MGEKRLGLALGGGAARGFAHVGVVQVLFDAGIRIHAIVGTSVGSLIGAALAAGKSCEEITFFGERISWLNLARLAWPNRGFLTFQPMVRLLEDWLGPLSIEDLMVPFGCVVSDPLTGDSRLLTSGPLAPRIRASCSVPPLVQPVLLEDRLYVDGGIVDNLPIRYTRQFDVDLVLAVNLFGPTSVLPKGIIPYSSHILGLTLVQAGDDPAGADCLVEPELTDFSLIRFKRSELIERGRQAMEAKLPDLQALLADDSVSASFDPGL